MHKTEALFAFGANQKTATLARGRRSFRFRSAAIPKA